MTPQELKNSILQLAIQGKLVEQRPEEGTAEELYAQIQAEKRKLIIAGKIKIGKPLPEIAEDEKPFDIPDTWKWVRLGDTFAIEMGQSPDGNSVSEFADGMEFHQGKVFFGEKLLKKSPQKTSMPTKIAPPCSVLLCVRAPVGKVNITDREICIGRGLCSVATIAGVSTDFVYYLLATYENIFIKQATGTTFVAITGAVVKNQAIPLPPLAEQKRIVAKIEELLPLIDRYEEAWTKLEEFNKRFPGDMQKSLLQMAIQGKLVDQRPEEGTAEELYQQIQAEKQALIKAGKIKKEKLLPEIAEEEKPFDIPESWKWVRLGEILTSTDAGKSPQCEDRSRTGNEWGVIKTTAIQNGFFLPEENKVLPEKFAVQEGQIVHSGDLLITRAGPRNRTGVLCVVSDAPTNLILSDKTVRLSYIKGLVEPMFIMYMLNSPAGQVSIIGAMTGMAASQVNISQDSMKKFLLALPPLAEQKRIVAKLEELLPLCERLK